MKDKPSFKSRTVYILFLLITVLLGLGSRYFSEALPHFVVFHFGDALWASMVYFVFRLLFINKPPAFAVWSSLVFSFAIETSQLYQADWINAIRSTSIGALILGHGFLWVDLFRYTSGVIVACAVDKLITKYW